MRTYLCVNYSTNLSFETKCVSSIIDQVLVNIWRAQTSIIVVKPWLIAFRKKEKEPSLIQIRGKFQNESNIVDYVQNFLDTHLLDLSKEKIYNVHSVLGSFQCQNILLIIRKN